MSQQLQPNPNASIEQRHPALALRIARFIIFAFLPLLIGTIPFVTGVAIQALWPRRIPAYIIGPLAVALFFTLRSVTDWIPRITVGEGGPAWPPMVLSLIIFVVCFSTGTTLLRDLLPRRFITPATLPNPQ
jgi:hypothetical protein